MKKCVLPLSLGFGLTTATIWWMLAPPDFDAQASAELAQPQPTAAPAAAPLAQLGHHASSPVFAAVPAAQVPPTRHASAPAQADSAAASGGLDNARGR